MLKNLKEFILKYYSKLKNNHQQELLTPKEDEPEYNYIKIKLLK